MYREILSTNHYQIANILSLIGFVHEQMNDVPEAVQYYHESRSIYREKFGSEHKDVKRLEGDTRRLTNS